MTKQPEYQPMPFPGEVTPESVSVWKMQQQVWETISTTFHGEPCRVQPKAGQIPELDVGKRGTGCEYKTYPPSPDTAKAKEGQLDIPSLYKMANEQTVHIKGEMTLPHGEKGKAFELGSGVIVGKKGDEILVMTDNHVVAKQPGLKTRSLQARFGDGHVYDGAVVVRDPKTDTALVAFKTGSETSAEYHPAHIQDGWSKLKRGNQYLIAGYPEATSLLHASPGPLMGLGRESSVPRMEHIPGDNRSRFWGLIRAHTRQGNSGGPTYAADGTLVGTFEALAKHDTRFSFINPISKGYVRSLLKKAGADTE